MTDFPHSAFIGMRKIRHFIIFTYLTKGLFSFMMIEIAHKKTKIANRFLSTASKNISEMKIVKLYSFLTSNGINHGWVHLCAILNGLFFVKKVINLQLTTKCIKISSQFMFPSKVKNLAIFNYLLIVLYCT